LASLEQCCSSGSRDGNQGPKTQQDCGYSGKPFHRLYLLPCFLY
jgi:hypothetical protein